MQPKQFVLPVIKEQTGFFNKNGHPRLVNAGLRYVGTDTLYADPHGNEVSGFFPAGSSTYPQGGLSINVVKLQDPVTHQTFYVTPAAHVAYIAAQNACCTGGPVNGANLPYALPLFFTQGTTTSNSIALNLGAVPAGATYDVSIDGGATTVAGLTGLNATGANAVNITGLVANTNYNIVLITHRPNYNSSASQINPMSTNP